MSTRKLSGAGCESSVSLGDSSGPSLRAQAHATTVMIAAEAIRLAGAEVLCLLIVVRGYSGATRYRSHVAGRRTARRRPVRVGDRCGCVEQRGDSRCE